MQPQPTPMYAEPIPASGYYQSNPAVGQVPQQQGAFLDGAVPSSDDSVAYGNPNARFQTTGWRDVPFVIAFGIHFILMIVVAGVYGPDLSAALKSDARSPSDHSNSDYGEEIGLIVVAAILGVVVSWLWLRLLQAYSGAIIKTCMIVSIVFLIICIIISLSVGLWFTGVMYIVWAVFLGIWYMLVQRQIPFAEATLSSSIQSIRDNPGPIYVAYFFSVVQIAWLAFWSFCFVAVAYAANNNCSVNPKTGQTECSASPSQNLSLVFCLFSLYWVAQVLSNISHVTTAGTVASWWLTPNVAQPTKGALYRACTTSIGTICFGSLLVAIIELVRELIRRSNSYGAAFVACLLDYLDRFVRWCNKFAFVEVAMYGYGFIDAARATKNLFVAKFWEILINDNLTSMVFRMGCFLAGATAGVICGLWAWGLKVESWVFIAVLAFIVAYLMAALVMTVLDSAVVTTLVCWAEDPATLQQNRPQEFGRIIAAADATYGQLYQDAFVRHPVQSYA